MAVSNKPWSQVSAADYADANAYCRACLVDANAPGSPKAKGSCSLPVYEPGGALNRNAVHAAAAVLAGGRGGVSASPADRRAAARRLVGLYAQLNETPPDSLRQLAK